MGSDSAFFDEELYSGCEFPRKKIAGRYGLSGNDKPKVVKFKNYDCLVEKKKYQDGSIRLNLIDVEDGMPVCTATKFYEKSNITNKEEYSLIKNYAENEGILNCLVENKIIELTETQYEVGYVTLHLVKVLI